MVLLCMVAVLSTKCVSSSVLGVGGYLDVVCDDCGCDATWFDGRGWCMLPQTPCCPGFGVEWRERMESDKVRRSPGGCPISGSPFGRS